MAIGETYESYLESLKQNLSQLEQQSDQASGLDERLDVLIRLQMEQIKLLQTVWMSPGLVTEQPQYHILEIDLSKERVDKEYKLAGSYISFSTDGDRGEMSLKMENATRDPISLEKYNHISGSFRSFFLTNTAQSGKSLTLFIGGDRARASGMTPATDNQGNLYVGIMGEYDSTLKTIATDDIGRIKEIIGDPEDVWGITRETGLMELASRINAGVVPMDKRGDLLWWDKLDTTVAGWVAGGDAGTTFALDTTKTLKYAKNGLLTLPVGVNKVGTASKYLPLISDNGGRYGLEISLEPDTGSLSNARIVLGVYDGEFLHQADIRIDLTGGLASDPSIIRYINEVGASEILDNWNYSWDYSSDFSWNTLKFVIDIDTGEYVRVLFNNLVYDMSGISYYKAANTTTPKIQITLLCTNSSGAVASDMHFENVILTHNEPG